MNALVPETFQSRTCLDEGKEGSRVSLTCSAHLFCKLNM
jgi:hypothetical protein